MNPNAFRLLVVDDSESMRRVISGVLTRLGFERIDQACDGMEGLARIAAQAYDLVVTDLSMPRMTGVELTRAIRALPERERTPVLMVSGQLTERNIREALEVGVDGFVAKPFVEGPLTERVTRLLLRGAVPPVAASELLRRGALPSEGMSGPRGLA